MSLADLIQNADARGKVKDAEAAKGRADLANATTSLGLAFDMLFTEVRQKHDAALVGPLPIEGRSFVQDAASVSMRAKLQKVAKTVDALILGIEPAKFRRFTEITPLRQWSFSGEVRVVWSNRDPSLLTVQDFDFCYGFVIDFGLRLLPA